MIIFLGFLVIIKSLLFLKNNFHLKKIFFSIIKIPFIYWLLFIRIFRFILYENNPIKNDAINLSYESLMDYLFGIGIQGHSYLIKYLNLIFKNFKLGSF